MSIRDQDFLALQNRVDRIETVAQSLDALANTIKVPYAKSGVLVTDAQGRASFDRKTPIYAPYNPSCYSANTGTWTVDLADQVVARYVVVAGVMTLQLVITKSTTSAGMGTVLFYRLPHGWRAISHASVTFMLGAFRWNSAGGVDMGTVLTNTNDFDDYILFVKRDGTAFASNEAGTFNLDCTITFPVYHASLRPLTTPDLRTV